MHTAQSGEQTRAGSLQGRRRLLMEHSPHSHIPTFPHPTCRAEEGMAEETHRSQTRPWNSVVLRSRSLTVPFFLLKIQALEESYKYCTGSIVPTPQCCSHIHMGTSRTHPRVRVTHSWHAWTVNHIYQYRNHRPTKPTPLMHCPITPKKSSFKNSSTDLQCNNLKD